MYEVVSLEYLDKSFYQLKKSRGATVRTKLFFCHILGTFFFFFDISTHEKGRGIRTSDIHFIRRGLQPIELLLKTHTLETFEFILIPLEINYKSGKLFYE
jgi:hypothetical protein